MKGQTEGRRHDGLRHVRASVHSIVQLCVSNPVLPRNSEVPAEAASVTTRFTRSPGAPWCRPLANLAIIPLHGKPVAVQPMAGVFQTATARVCRGERSGVLDAEPARDVEPADALGKRDLSMSTSKWETLRDNSPVTTQFRASGLAAGGNGLGSPLRF